jgi:hypothetical protein
MKKIYNDINLNNVVLQLEDKDLPLGRQFLKFNSAYMNYIDTDGSVQEQP